MESEVLLREIRRKAKELGIEEPVEEEIKGFEKLGAIEYLGFLKDYLKALKEKGITAMAYHNDHASSFILFLLGLHPANPVRYGLDNKLFLKKRFKKKPEPFRVDLSIALGRDEEAIEILKGMPNLTYEGLEQGRAYLHRVLLGEKPHIIGLLESPQLHALEKGLAQVGLSLEDIPEEDEETIRYMLQEDDKGYYLPFLSGCLLGPYGELYELVEIAKPTSLKDLAKLLCLTYGTIEDKGYWLSKLKEEGLEGVFSCKEDIYITLTEIYDLDEGLALYLSGMAPSKGKGLSEADRLALESLEVKESYIELLERIRYVPRLSFGLGIIEIAYRIAFLKAHHGVIAENLWARIKRESYVGPFFYIGEKLFSYKERADDFDADRRYFDVGLSHFLFFESLGIDDDYGHYPRGRVIYDNLNCRFLVYLDRSLLEKKKEELIIKEFKLENMRVRFLLDEHYEHDGL